MPKEKIASNEEFLKKIAFGRELLPKQKNNLELVFNKIKEQLKSFNENLIISYGGSYARNTLIKEVPKLDIIVYWPKESDKDAEIVHKRLGLFLKKSWRKAKPKNLGWEIPFKSDFHIDIIPGVLKDEGNQYASFYNAIIEEEIETSIKLQDDYIKDNNRMELIRLLKIWKYRRGVPLHNFILELLCVKYCKGISRKELEKQLLRVFNYLLKDIEDLKIKDPINKENDLSYLMDEEDLQLTAKFLQEAVESKTWNKVFKK
ncbi:MAG: hypothetical protein ACP6IY_07455 [Promethearchaeia archaeon]